MKKLIFAFFLSAIALFSFTKTTHALNGMDVSEFQGNIDFSLVAKDNIEVVYIRSSASSSYIDAKFERNYKYARENNLKIGFYHYVTARTIAEAEEQARFFASVVSGKQVDCPLAMDFEVFTGLTKEETNAISRTFLETLEKVTGKKTIVYSDASNARYTFDSYISSNYPLWIAQYGVEEPQIAAWPEWHGWQYTDRGRVSGINGNV
ncbi:MAG: glycosyl hydrolase family 25, partial [Bacilli bacterium]|nr:glycosyl hydrolase family 25 [Bacilli bacterium]